MPLRSAAGWIRQPRPTWAGSIPRRLPQVRAEAWPEATTPDELHDALNTLGLVTEAEGTSNGWARHLDALIEARRAARLERPAHTSGSAPNVCR